MIILTTAKGTPAAIRPSNIVAVEQHPEDPAYSAVMHILTRASKKTSTMIVKHTVQEVVDAISKVENFI